MAKKTIEDKLNDFIDEYVGLEDFPLSYTFQYVDENGYHNDYNFVYYANLFRDEMETDIKIHLIDLINDKKLKVSDLRNKPYEVIEEITEFLLPTYEAAAFTKCSNQNSDLEFIERD